MERLCCPRNHSPKNQLVWLEARRATLVADLRAAPARQRVSLAKAIPRVEAEILSRQRSVPVVAMS